MRASVSPPGHTAEDKPSVSKPAENITLSISFSSETLFYIFFTDPNIDDLKKPALPDLLQQVATENAKALNLLPLTELLQGGDPILVIMVIRQRRCAFSHDFCSDGLGWHLHRLHTTDEGLKPLVGERRLTPI